MIDTIVSHYKILDQLGGGGMGVVYKALDLRLDRTVALKLLPPDLARDPEAKQRFIQEAKAASALQHTNICVIHDIDQTDDGQTFMCMELYEGETVREKIARAPLPLPQAVDIATQVAAGLACAHEAGIVHRDIKPANIMVTTRGEVKILDFGLAKLSGQTLMTKAGTTLGTVAYMAPEQARAELVDRRADIWAMGAVLYEMLTGRPPFPAEYAPATLYAIINTDPEPVTALRSGVPMELERVILKALAKNPDDRYQHADDMAADLKGVARLLQSGTTGMKPKETTAAPARRTWVRIAAIAIAGLIVLAGGAYLLFRPTTGPIDSIAVLPLDNFSGDATQEYFSDGMTEAIIAELYKIEALRVISRTSAMSYKHTTKTLPQIARELNVKAVIEGSVARSGDNVRITVQLVGVSPERHIWANTFNSNARDILELQSDVARAIVREIRVAVSPDEQRRLAVARKVDPRAHDAYLKALASGNRYTEEGFRKAIEYLQTAIALDTNFSAAYAGLGLVTSALVAYGYGWIPPKEGWPTVKALALKALEKDETNAEAHAILGQEIYYFEWDAPNAEKEYRRAVELNPGAPFVHFLYTDFLGYQRRYPEALVHARKSSELDPLSLEFRRAEANVYYISRAFDSAEIKLKEILTLEPRFAFAHRVLAWIYSAEKRSAEAIAEAKTYMELQPGDIQGEQLLCQTYAASGNRAEAERMLKQLLAVKEKTYISATWLARVYGMLGDKDRAFGWLDRAYDERDIDLVTLRTDQQFDALRPDARFARLIKRIGLE